MDKSDLYQLLINDIKNAIEYDSDVTALKSLLLKLLDLSIASSFSNWKYIILKYDLRSLEADFSPITKDYPIELIKKIGINNFFTYMKKLPILKSQIIYEQLFNIYNKRSFIYQSLDYYIKNNNINSEKDFIQSILTNSSHLPKLIFDKNYFIRLIIISHIDSKNIPKEFLKELINEVHNKKEQAVLKTLLLDYLVF